MMEQIFDIHMKREVKNWSFIKKKNETKGEEEEVDEIQPP